MDSVPSITVLQYLALIHQVTYVNVCKDVGITPQQFSDWVKKRRPVPKERLQSLAEYFKIEPNLIIDEKHYLQDLTAEMKIDVQILFLKQTLEKADDAADMEAYREKLIALQNEKEQQALIGRFDAIVKQNDKETRQICEAFLDQIEHGNFTLLQKILIKKESDR
ncbi:hypothetical protein PP175_08770 [Aneurinibacillus sp. Ricciae_BoGa-3]|uniref:hypothetical protein n=1 Tax=Aneurinibacillus sp. Ricciae_BoGa-3 TaxID=3022697 RepID=UPI0023424E79|nr:hypothetical protein [Aneurinibacillus sp. Ricciae_BoGa-3]WCK55990.1 hypothetical protein PP175_08770 [Aneurinibacillus sp. Ricciae_BoGa-3]